MRIYPQSLFCPTQICGEIYFFSSVRGPQTPKKKMSATFDDSPSARLERVKKAIVSIADFPKPGIVFRDFFPLLATPSLTRDLTAALAATLRRSLTGDWDADPPVIAGLDSRGFVVGSLLSVELGLGFVPIRKKGKLPPPVFCLEYNLEYGSDALEVSTLALARDRRVVVVDDLMATGGTMSAAEKLVTKVGARVELCLVVVELTQLGGRSKLTAPLESLIEYD